MNPLIWIPLLTQVVIPLPILLDGRYLARIQRVQVEE
jgi:hypothetical protein